MPCPSTAWFLVLAPIVGPVVARPGNYVCLWLGHAVANLWVLDATGERVLARANVAEGVLYSMLLDLCNDDVIRGLSSADYALVRVRSA
jgi:hypothetical protein